MAQVYKMMLGTSGRQWEQMTVRDDGTMMLYFHGTDRSVTQQVSAVTEGEWKGWLKSEKGSMWPGLESGRWKLINAAEQTAAEKQRTTAAGASDDSSVVSDFVADYHVREEEVKPVIMNHESLIVNQAKPTPSPRRQRKPRKPLAAVESRNDDTEEPENDYAWLQSAGYLAAASVALLIIWQTGLIIPLGLIGLATGGLLK